jgi:hypothetical protein
MLVMQNNQHALELDRIRIHGYNYLYISKFCIGEDLNKVGSVPRTRTKYIDRFHKTNYKVSGQIQIQNAQYSNWQDKN